MLPHWTHRTCLLTGFQCFFYSLTIFSAFFFLKASMSRDPPVGICSLVTLEISSFIVLVFMSSIRLCSFVLFCQFVCLILFHPGIQLKSLWTLSAHKNVSFKCAALLTLASSLCHICLLKCGEDTGSTLYFDIQKHFCPPHNFDLLCV